MTKQEFSQEIRLERQESVTDKGAISDKSYGIGADLLIGAEAIAKALNWKTVSGKWNKRRVYHLAETSKMPIHKVPGLGLVCRKTTIDSYFRSLDEKFLRALDEAS